MTTPPYPRNSVQRLPCKDRGAPAWLAPTAAFLVGYERRHGQRDGVCDRYGPIGVTSPSSARTRLSNAASSQAQSRDPAEQPTVAQGDDADQRRAATASDGAASNSRPRPAAGSQVLLGACRRRAWIRPARPTPDFLQYGSSSERSKSASRRTRHGGTGPDCSTNSLTNSATVASTSGLCPTWPPPFTSSRRPRADVPSPATDRSPASPSDPSPASGRPALPLRRYSAEYCRCPFGGARCQTCSEQEKCDGNWRENRSSFAAPPP